MVLTSVFSRATITSLEGNKVTTLDLLDNGSGADKVANDGVYSRFFATGEKADRYILKCEAKGDTNTKVNLGLRSAERSTRLDQESPMAPICCGSEATLSSSVLEPTGLFARDVVGGSFRVGFNCVVELRCQL